MSRVELEQFVDVKKPEAAYLLGLIWADGWINRKDVAVQMVDEDMVDLVKVFETTGDWRTCLRRKEGRKPQRQFVTNNVEWKAYLESHGYGKKSTQSACSILSTIPEHLRHYWFRGLFDGDGCIFISDKKRIQNMFVSSTYEQDWTYMEGLAERLGLRFYCRRIKRRQPSHRAFANLWSYSSIFEVVNLLSCHALGTYLYQGYEIDGIGLKRKHAKWLRIKARQPVRKCNPLLSSN